MQQVEPKLSGPFRLDQCVNTGLQWTAVACQCAGPDTGEHKGASFYFISTCVHIHLSGDIYIRLRRSEVVVVVGGGQFKNPHWGSVVAVLNIYDKPLKSWACFQDLTALKSPDGCHSSHSVEANAIRPVNQAIKFNLAHLSTPGLPTEALCLRMQNEAREPAGIQGTVMFFGG